MSDVVAGTTMVDDAELTAEQAEALRRWCGPLLVLGGPGTGKTTLVAQAATQQVRAGGSPLVLASGRTAASALRNRIAQAVGGTSQLTVTTVHALARSLVDRYAGADWRLLTAPEQEFRVRELLAGDAGTRWPESLRQALGTHGFARQVRTVLARARQLGLDPEDVVAHGERAGLPEWVAVGEFFAEYLDVLDAEATLDYAELVHRARILLADPAVLEAVRQQYDAVLADDVTDLDPAQLGLVRALVPDCGLVLATADPQAAVNTFRGAHPRIAAEFTSIFTGHGGVPGELVVLRQGQRAGGELAAALARVAARLPVAVPGAPADPLPAGRPGTVRVLTCRGDADQARAIAAELRRARIERGIAYREMAVLARSGSQLPAIGRACAAAGIPVHVAGDEIALAQAQAVRPLLLVLEVAARGELRPDEAVRLLTSPLAGFDPVGLRQVVRQWRAAHPGAVDATGQAPAAEDVLARAVNDPAWLEDGAATPVRSRLADLVALLAAAREAVAAGRRADEVAWAVWNGTRWPARLRAEALAGGPAGRQADRDLDAVAAFFELAAETTGAGAAGVRLLLEAVAAQQIPADREREARAGARGVQLLTAHRARGREWALVVVAGVQEGSWPAGRQVSALLEPERLLSDGIGPRPDPRERLTQERRLFYVACGRARDELVVTATAGTEGEANQPSRFLAELGVEPERPVAGPPVTLPALVGELRRVLVSPEVAEPRRLAAAANLAALAAERLPDGSPLVPLADPARWWGVKELSSGPLPADGPIRLSPSQVSALLTCPRRYFLSRAAHADGPPAVGASLGSVIHLLVQHASTGGLDDAAVGGHLDAAWQHLRFDTGWLSAVERVEAEVSVQRFLAWRESRPEPVAVEAPFQFELGLDGRQVTLAGAVDRLERTPDGRLAVVDFKTGRTTPTRDEVAGMDQLGIYQLAVEREAFAEVAGPASGSAGASVVYLRQSGKTEGLPKELAQDPLADRPHLSGEDGSAGYPTWVHHRVARAAAVVADGSYRAAPGTHCRRCPFADSCPASGCGEQVLR